MSIYIHDSTQTSFWSLWNPLWISFEIFEQLEEFTIPPVRHQNSRVSCLIRKPWALLIRFSSISDAASCSSRLEILPYWSSLFVLVVFLFPKEALLISNQTHFYSSFILVCSLNERVGNGLIFIVSSCWMSGTVCTPVCTINRLHVARRPRRPSTGAGTYAEVDLAVGLLSAMLVMNEVWFSFMWSHNTKLFSEQKTNFESVNPDLRASRRT